MLHRRINLGLISVILAAGPVASRSLHAQAVDIARDGSFVTLTYTKAPQNAVTVEQTSDFLYWIPADASESVIAQDGLNQIMTSAVPINGIKRLFLRVRIDNSWKASLAWNASPGPGIAGYCLHYGTVRGNYTRHLVVGNVTRATVSVPASAKTYYFAVTAYNGIGLESLPSKSVAVSMSSASTTTTTTAARKRR
ncbi:MAG: hypothetical protein QOH39_1859 [Verrucomicrobiota bacterium]|jgi:hypothetical protein